MRKNLTITVTLSQELLREVNKRCKAEDLNRSQWIRKLIRAHQLNQQSPTNADPPTPDSGES
jgi:metal-responsive CopG/Arc/MetJ family transcriptional regulator